MALKLLIQQKIYDKQDNDFTYEVGDIYPRKGLKVSEERIKEVKSKINAEFLFKEMTVDELKNHLDEMGVEYDKDAKKGDLLELVGD